MFTNSTRLRPRAPENHSKVCPPLSANVTANRALLWRAAKQTFVQVGQIAQIGRLRTLGLSRVCGSNCGKPYSLSGERPVFRRCAKPAIGQKYAMSGLSNNFWAVCQLRAPFESFGYPSPPRLRWAAEEWIAATASREANALTDRLRWEF